MTIGPFAEKLPYWGIFTAKSRHRHAIFTLGCTNPATSPCPTISAHTVPIPQGHNWKWASQIVRHIHAI